MFATAPASRSRIAPRHFAWLLWLALLLPVGQLAAMAHAVTHSGGESTRQAERDKGLPETACDLCLISVAIGAGGLRGAPPPLPDPAVCDEIPQAARDCARLPRAAPAYLSRAPPFSAPH